MAKSSACPHAYHISKIRFTYFSIIFSVLFSKAYLGFGVARDRRVKQAAGQVARRLQQAPVERVTHTARLAVVHDADAVPGLAAEGESGAAEEQRGGRGRKGSGEKGRRGRRGSRGKEGNRAEGQKSRRVEYNQRD